MKKYFIRALLLSVLTLSSCNVGKIDSTSTSKIDKDKIDVLSIIDRYKEDETLSFSNYLKYSFKSNVYYDNNKYYFDYNEYQVEYDLNSVVLNKKSNNDFDGITLDCVDDLISFNCNIGDIIQTKEYYKNYNKGGTRYKIVKDKNEYTISLNNGLYAIPLVDNYTISIEALGAYGDGKHDDSKVINSALNYAKDMNIKTILFNSKKYLCNSRLNIGEINDLAVIGDNSTFIVNDEYDDSNYTEFFFNIWECNNFLLSEINITYNFTRAINGIKTQVGIHNSKKIEYVNSYFNIPQTTLALQSKDREFTNFDCYQGWEDIILNNCTFELLTDSEAGGSLWIRDFRNAGSKNIKVLNSYFHKIAHDELIAVFMGTIENVLIKNNTFKVEDSGDSSSVMNFTFGSQSSNKADNIIFEDNNIDVYSTGGLIWSNNATNVVIRNNIINSRISSKANGHFRMIEAQNGSKIDVVENNTVTFDSSFDDVENKYQVHIFKDIKKVLNNKVIINSKITDLFLNIEDVKDNICEINAYAQFVAYNVSKIFKNNTITLNNNYGSFFRYYGLTLSSNIELIDNTINYLYSETDDDDSYVIMLNDMYMANYIISLSNNIITTKEISKKSRFLFVAPSDETTQNFKATNNLIGNYNSPKNDYIKNCVIEY